MFRLSLSLTLLTVFCSPALSQAQTPKSKNVKPPVKWQAIAKAKGMTAAEIALLQKNKIVIGALQYKQIFTPYLSSDVPLFITTDSLLNGFHVLFEESIYRMELAHARRLPAILQVIWKKIDAAEKKAKGDPKLIAAGAKRARIFLATARLLLDDKAQAERADIRALAADEARRITQAKAKMKPSWLGPPDEGFIALDYSRFLPRGFYSRSPKLQKYFRAVS